MDTIKPDLCFTTQVIGNNYIYLFSKKELLNVKKFGGKSTTNNSAITINNT